MESERKNFLLIPDPQKSCYWDEAWVDRLVWPNKHYPRKFNERRYLKHVAAVIEHNQRIAAQKPWTETFEIDRQRWASQEREDDKSSRRYL